MKLIGSKLDKENLKIWWWLGIYRSKGKDWLTGEDLEGKIVQVHHYIHEAVKPTRYLIENAFALTKDNHVKIHFQGEAEFHHIVEQKLGTEYIDNLIRISKNSVKFNMQYIEEWNDLLKRLFKEAIGLEWEDFNKLPKEIQWEKVLQHITGEVKE